MIAITQVDGQRFNGAGNHDFILLGSQSSAMPLLGDATRTAASRRIAPIGARDVDAAAAVVARAFMQDPLMVYAWPDERRRRRALHSAFPVLARFALRNGMVLATQPDIAAAGIWVAPGNFPISDVRLARHGSLAWYLTMGRIGMKRLWGAMGESDEVHEAATPGPHWYLWALGVDTGHQGQGIGSAILREGLARCDAQHVPCWLETTQPRNVPLYARHGFEVFREFDPVCGAPHTWGMLRPAGVD